jgi:hypothetical protein
MTQLIIQWWKKPVRMCADERTTVVVTHTLQAAKVLLDSWPTDFDNGSTVIAAMTACLAALEGKKKPHQARAAFQAAAEKADLVTRNVFRNVHRGY